MAAGKIDFACKIETLNETTGVYEIVGNLIMGYGLAGREEAKHGIYFKPHRHATDSALRNFFGINQTGRKTVEYSETLPSVSDILPTKGTFLDEKLSYLITGFGARNDAERFKALMRNQGRLEKYGMRMTDITPGAENTNIREANVSRQIDSAKKEKLNDQAKEILEALTVYAGIYSNDDVKPGGHLENNQDYADFIVKSCGSSHLVFDDPRDPSKLLKVISAKDEKTRDSLINFEVLASKVIDGGKMKAPKSDIVELSDKGGKAIAMDNFAVRNGVNECRRQSFMSFLGKRPQDIHEMTYDEMAKGLEHYERQLPQELQNKTRLNENKIAIAQWAMVNSAMNNTDNHGRNLEVLKDSDGRIEISPFYDVAFDSNDRPMSTAIDGIPPIHKIDITNDAEIERLCEHLNIDDPSQVMESRNQLVESIAKIPEHAAKLGMDVFSPEMDHVIRSVSMQSDNLKEIVTAAIEQARNKKLENNADLDNTSSMEAGF